MSLKCASAVEIKVQRQRELHTLIPAWEAFVARNAPIPLSYHPQWMSVLARGLRQTPYYLEAVAEDRTAGLLPLMHVRSLLFGRFLIGLPYLNYGGIITD